MLTQLLNRWRWNLQRLRRLKQVFWQLEQFPAIVQKNTESNDRIIARLEAENAQLKKSLRLLSKSLDWVAETTTQANLPLPGRAPLVSVILPTWNRAAVIARALESIRAQKYEHWECLIVDDGSTDATELVIAPYLQDSRFQFFRQPHQNAAIARNLGLAKAQGEIIAYLDTDNVWFPNYLTAIVTAFVEDDSLQSVYTAQLIEHSENATSFVRCDQFDHERLRQENYIDLNVFAHRAELSRRLGRFDEALESLQDWDLALRYTKSDKVKRIPVIGGIYANKAKNQISRNVPHAHSKYLIQQKYAQPKTHPLKVLYALWHYPQLSESYVRCEIQAALKLGVEIEVWSEEAVAAPYESEVPFHRGSLETVLQRFRPDVVHTHWLHFAQQQSSVVAQAGLPMTVRGHGFEFSLETLAHLDQNPTIKAIYVFPHQATRLASKSAKIKSLPSSFNPDWYSPHKMKDRKLVFRTGCALPSKDYASFMKTAMLCPEHRFVLNVCQAYQVESYLDQVIELNRSFGNPVEIISNLQQEDVAKWMQQAGIYLHTVTVSGQAATPFGMPISICEAMATGSYIIGRRCPGSPEYIGDVGAYYDSPEEAAALINQTLRWPEEQWNLIFRKSVNRAYQEFVHTENIKPIIADWEEFAGQNFRGDSSYT
ncbi:MAG: glycosyltransferase [Blastocatellia bacterium]